jgi:hypothetical protein
VLEDPKGGTFLPKKDIWSPYISGFLLPFKLQLLERTFERIDVFT